MLASWATKMALFCLFFLSSFLYESKHYCQALRIRKSTLMESGNIIEEETTRGSSSHQLARKDSSIIHRDYDDGKLTDDTVLKFLQTGFTHFTKRISKIFSINNNQETVLHTSRDVFQRDSNKLLTQKARDKRNTKNDTHNALLQQSGGEMTHQMPHISPLTLEPSHVNASHEITTVSSSRNTTDSRLELQINWNRSEQTTNATVCLSVLLLVLLFVVYRSKMWREKDEYWSYLAAPDSRFNLDDDWTYNRHNRPRLNVNLKEMLQSKVQALQMLFRKAKRRRGLGGKYTRLTSIDEQDSEDELFTQPV